MPLIWLNSFRKKSINIPSVSYDNKSYCFISYLFNSYPVFT